MSDLEVTVKTDKIFDRLIKDINDAEDAFDEYTNNYKGYMYDSLCYRYQLARYKACEADAIDLTITKGLPKREAEAEARKNYNRDVMRFCQILDEAIGEHS